MLSSSSLALYRPLPIPQYGASPSDIHQFIINLNTLPDGPRVYERGIWFRNTQDQRYRTSKTEILGEDNGGYYSAWLRVPVPPKSGILAYFENAILGCANPDAHSQWHAWAAFLVDLDMESPTRGTKHRALIIYDSEPRELEKVHSENKPRYIRLMTRAQRHLVERIRGKRSIAQVWYNTDTSLGKQLNCVPNTLKWLKDIAEYGNKPLESNDVRLQGFIEVCPI